jgi:hypothetical protein
MMKSQRTLRQKSKPVKHALRPGMLGISISVNDLPLMIWALPIEEIGPVHDAVDEEVKKDQASHAAVIKGAANMCIESARKQSSKLLSDAGEVILWTVLHGEQGKNMTRAIMEEIKAKGAAHISWCFKYSDRQSGTGRVAYAVSDNYIDLLSPQYEALPNEISISANGLSDGGHKRVY